MKNQTIIREIDSVGRIVLPKEFRDLFNIKGLDEVELAVTEQGLLIKPANR